MNTIGETIASAAFATGFLAGFTAGSPGWARPVKPQPHREPAPKHFGRQDIPPVNDQHEMLERARRLMRQTKVERADHVEQAKAALAQAWIAA
jgi:hypothetical protein